MSHQARLECMPQPDVMPSMGDVYTYFIHLSVSNTKADFDITFIALTSDDSQSEFSYLIITIYRVNSVLYLSCATRFPERGKLNCKKKFPVALAMKVVRNSTNDNIKLSKTMLI